MKINGDFDELIDIINESSNEELESKLESFEPNLKNFEFEYWVDEIFNKDIDRIDINKMPQLLDIFCRSFDRFKFMLFYMMLEATIERVPYLTNLENIPLCEEKWGMLKHTVSVIIRNVGNQIVNCMFLLLINNDPEGRYLTDEEKENIIYGINANLNAINRYLEKMEASKIDISIFMTLELVIDAACYIHDDDTTKK